MKKFIFSVLFISLFLISPLFCFELLSPEGTLWVYPGEAVKILLKAPPEGKVSFSLGEFYQKLPMSEQSPGIYQGCLIAPEWIVKGEKLYFHFEKKGEFEQFTAPAEISILDPRLPLVARIKEEIPGRSGPGEGYSRLLTLPVGAELPVKKRAGCWLQLELFPDFRVWGEFEAVKLLPPGAFPGLAELLQIKVEKKAGKPQVNFKLSGVSPFSFEQSLNPPALTVSFYRTLLKMGEIVLDPEVPLISEIKLVQENSQLVKASLLFSKPFIWGYQGEFKGENFILELRESPAIQEDSLSGISVALDAGHGGEDPGAVGVLGKKEKDLNLKVAESLKPLLSCAGAKVILTRKGDYELTPHQSLAKEELDARLRAGKKQQATVFISIHHNAKEKIAEARQATGTYVYYFHPQSLALAKAIAAALAGELKEEKFAPVWRSFFLLRESFFPSVLVECAFISNPQEEKKLSLPDYPQKAAEGIYQGLLDFFKAAALP